MLLIQIVVLALVQGVTEFLPISSSGHLVLTSQVLCWPDQGMMIDVAVHVGTLFSVLLYFWRETWTMTTGFFRLVTFRGGPSAQLVLNVIIGTIPVVIVGFLAKDQISTVFRSVEIIAWTTLIFGLLLWVADRIGLTVWRVEHIKAPTALIIGLAQVLALIPGTSRSGITMTAARFLGMERAECARFSLLLSIPTIAAAGLLAGKDLVDSGQFSLQSDAVIAAALAFVAGYLSIALLMRWLRVAGFGPFVLYRVLLGAGLLYWVYVGFPTPMSSFCG